MGGSLDVLEDQIGPAVLTHASVEQARDVGVGEACQETRFVPYLLGSSRTQSSTVEELDGHVAFVLAIATASEPHASHPAAAERALERVGTDTLADEGSSAERRALHEA